MLVGYTATVCWGVGGVRDVSVGGVSQLSLLDVFDHRPLLSPVYTTTAILSEKRKGMHSSGLQHTCYREYHYLVGS